MTIFHFNITDRAHARVQSLIAARNQGKKLRIEIDSGGCSGMQYKYAFTDEVEEGDHIIERDGVCYLIDKLSQQFLKGATLEYIETLGSAYFQISNPMASAKCGCGNSFSV